jgi:hypothetical protein
MLEFERTISLGKISNPVLSHEPDNTLWLHGTESISDEHKRIVSKFATPVLGQYDNLNFQAVEGQITEEYIDTFGVKHVPLFGASAFYAVKDTDKTKFVVPVKPHM